MTDYIYRAGIKNDGEKITYRNSAGKSVTYKPYSFSDAKLLFSSVNKYFTGKSPNITPKEQVQLRADFAKSLPTCKHNDGLFIRLDFALKTFSDKNSEGGENITPNEVYQMYEMFHKWTE